MPRQGNEFHRLVEHLQRAVVNQPDVTIEAPKYLPDRITGALREHDIVLIYQSPQWKLMVAIECRDRTRKVSVGQVEEFHSKCNDTGISSGVIVSSAGFFKTAQKKAANYGIRCLMLEQVHEVDWCSQAQVPVLNRSATNVQVFYGFPLSLQNKHFKLYAKNPDDEDIEIDMNKPSILVKSIMPQLPEIGDERSGIVPVEIANLDDFYFVDDEGVKHPVKRLAMEIEYDVKETSAPLTFHRYRADSGTTIFEMAVSDVAKLGDIDGRIMVVKDESVGIRFRVVPVQTP